MDFLLAWGSWRGKKQGLHTYILDYNQLLVSKLVIKSAYQGGKERPRGVFCSAQLSCFSGGEPVAASSKKKSI